MGLIVPSSRPCEIAASAQDVLGLGSEARRTCPDGRAGMAEAIRGGLDDAVRDRLREMSEIYGRAPQRNQDAAQGKVS